MTTPTLTQDLLDQGIELFQQGSYQQALSTFDRCMEAALTHGESDLWDRAYCNRSGVAIELGEADESIRELREIVLRSSDDENAFLAAYNVARYYELEKDNRRASFYARVARDRCARLGRRDWLAWSHNQTGNLLIAESQFEEACTEYENALRVMPSPRSVPRALILDNLGYCRVVQGRHEEGFRLLIESVRTLSRFGAIREQARPRLSLCYAYLEIARLRPALRQGLRALEIATEHDDHGSVKNAHYLIAETYKQLGQDELAHDYFIRLQRRYYPEAPHVPDLLMAVDVRTLINLKA